MVVWVFLKKKSKGIWQVSGEVIFKGIGRVGDSAKLSLANGGVLGIGNDYAIAAGSLLVVEKRITFRSDCLVFWIACLWIVIFIKYMINIILLLMILRL